MGSGASKTAGVGSKSSNSKGVENSGNRKDVVKSAIVVTKPETKTGAPVIARTNVRPEKRDTPVKQTGNSGNGMSWLEVLDKVSNAELWEGSSRVERDPWRKYLVQADDIVRRPRKPIPKDVVCSILEGDLATVDVASVPNAQPKVVVFVSSTFTDTKAERNQLMKDVYPYLRELCRRLGIEFGTVDMRWGVTEEATNDHSTVQMCISEIKRCMKESMGPAFLCFVGNKYGYRPLPAQIEASEFETILQHLKDNAHDPSLIQEYYKRDDNAVPPNYVLKQKSSELKTWWDDVEKIQLQLREAVVACFGQEDEICDKYHVSVTEMEITEGVFGNSNQNEQARFVRRQLGDILSEQHCHRKLIDMNPDKTLDSYANEKLKELKEEKIDSKTSPGIVYDISYTNSDIAAGSEYIKSVCDHLCEELTTAILKGYESKLHVEDDREFQESIHHRAHAIEKASLFVGREREIDRIMDYIRSSDKRPLAVHGVSGCGKTAIMAVAARKAKDIRRESALILRFIGTTGQSGSARGLLLNLCVHITRIYGQDQSKIPNSYKDLIKYFQTCMSFANNSKPLILFLDSLDQLSNEDFGQNLAWLSLSEDLPENVKLIVSSLPTRCLDILKANIPGENLLEVTALNPSQGQDIMNKMLKLHNRCVTNTQEKVILDAFGKCPLPLFLRLIVDIAVKWRSYDDVNSGDIAEDMQGLITKLFVNLETRYGEVFVRHALAYITAAKYGLSLAELEDILSCDEEVLTSVFQWWTPPVRRIPPLLWARVRNELGMYLAERGTGGISAYGWYHRQFWETAQKRYLYSAGGGDNTAFSTKAHEAIADYFEGKWVDGKPYAPKGEKNTKMADRKLPSQSLIVSGDRSTRRQLNKRKLSELPYHLIQLKDWKRFTKLVMDLPYIEAKFEAQDGYNCLSELIEATKLSGDDSIKQLTRFVGSNLGFLIREPVAVYQMAFQLSKASATRELLNAVDPSYLPLPLMKYMNESDHPDPCEMTMYGHTETVRCCDYSPKGDLILSSADDTTMRIWDAVTGAELVTVTSLPAVISPPPDAPTQLILHPVNPCCFSRTGERIASGTELGDVMLWDVTGVQLHSQKTSHGSVNFIGFSNNNKYIATAFKNSVVSIWSASDVSHVATIDINGAELSGLDFSPDDKLLAVTNFRGLSLVDTESWQLKSTENGLAYYNLCCKFHPKLKQVMTGGDDSCVTIWDSSTGKVVTRFKRHNAWIWSIKFTADGERMFTCSSDRTMKIWSRRSDTEWTDFVSVGGHSHRVSMVAIDHSTGAKLVTSSLDRSLKVWDMKALFEGKTPPVGTGHFNVLVTSSNGSYCASSQGWHKTCNVFRPSDMSQLGSTPNQVGFIRDARFTVDETKLVLVDHGHTGTYDTGAEKDAVVKVVAIPGLNSLTNLPVNSPTTIGINRKCIVVGTHHGTIHLFDIDTCTEVNSWEFGNGGHIHALGCAMDNDRIAVCVGPCCKVWDASNAHCNHLKDLTDFDSTPIASQFNPAGSILCVGLNSGRIHTYEVTDNDIRPRKILTDHESYIKDIKFSPSGRYMVTTAGLSMRVWDVTKEMSLKCVYYSPVNYAAFLSDEVVLAGEATGLLKMLTF